MSIVLRSSEHIASSESSQNDNRNGLRRFKAKIYKQGFETLQGWKPKPGYVYTVVRAISARVNQNYDGWPSDELKKAAHTFIGKPVFVNHENHDPTKARGVVIAARYAENGNDRYIEVVQEIDAKRFPKLAHEIKTGGLDSVSMGAEAGFTICSYCHNKATDLHDMCDHVRNHKGKTLTRFDKRTGKKEDVLVFESCHKISFFELSYVFEPADETAVASKVVVAGLHKDAANDVTVPAPPSTPKIDQSVIDSTPVVNLSPATELTGHEAPGLGKTSAYDDDIAEITKLAGDCPPGMDCSRNLAQGDQITLENTMANTPDTGGVSGVSYSPGTIGKPGSGGTPDASGILPNARPLYDKLMELYPGSNIGGYRVDDYHEHDSGALDFMTSDEAQAAKVREQAFAAGAPYVLWKQQQWNPDGSTSAMEDRGDPTQNHFDHVHIAPLPAQAPKVTTVSDTSGGGQGVAPAQRAAGKYTKEDFAVADGKKPWERDKNSDAEDAAAIEIEAMLLTAGPTDDYPQWLAEHGAEAEAEGTHGIGAYFPSWEQKRWLRRQDILQRKLDFTASSKNLTNPEYSQDTTRRNTIATYLAAHDFLNGQGAPKGHSLDYGAGWGDSAVHPDLNAPRARFHTLEPHPNPGVEPDFRSPDDIDDGTYKRIHNLNVLNVAERGPRDRIVKQIGRILAPGGHAIITTRGRQEIESMLGSGQHAPGPESDPGSVLVNGGVDPAVRPDVRVRYQKGFTPDELHQYVSRVLGRGYTVTKAKGVGSAPAAVHVVRNADNVPAVPPRPIAEQARAARRRRSAAMKKTARQRALKLAFGEKEAPMAVNTLREEGSAPEDDNNDVERYVDPAKSEFEQMTPSPAELQDPDLSQAAQIDRRQEIDGAPADQIGGQPGPASVQPPAVGGVPAGPPVLTLQIPMPAAQQAGVPMAASPAAPVPAGPQPPQPQQIAASVLDYFDNYYGRRVANWLDAVEDNRAFTPAEAADYRRQAARLSTLENGRELSTTDRNPGKEPANMARNTIASRSKVARAGRRQHFAEGPLVDGGDRSRNDQGEQEEAFISQTPPEVSVDFPNEHSPISNTEHNLVARVQAGRDQLLRDAQALASMRQKRALTESGGPVAEVVDPTVHTGPEGEALTGTDFVSANPNDGVKPTNPHDASLRAFAAFDSWLTERTGSSSRRHTEANIKKAAAQFSREAGISPQALFPALGIVLREARKNDKQANTKGAKMRKRADEKLEVAAPDGRVDVEAPVANTTDAEAQASQFDLRDFGNNAGDNVAKPDLSTDQNWAPGEASGKKASIKTAGGLLAMRCAEGMIAAGLEPNSRERKYQLAAEFENMNRGLIQDRVALLERFAAVRQADLRKVASGSSRGAARSPIPAGLGGGTRTAAAGPRVAAHDPSNDSSLFI